MKVTILNKPTGEMDTRVQEYVDEFRRRTGKELELIDAESPEGVDLARLHDILNIPAIIVREDDGGFVQSWVEIEKWPTISELSYYTQ